MRQKVTAATRSSSGLRQRVDESTGDGHDASRRREKRLKPYERPLPDRGHSVAGPLHQPNSVHASALKKSVVDGNAESDDSFQFEVVSDVVTVLMSSRDRQPQTGADTGPPKPWLGHHKNSWQDELWPYADNPAAHSPKIVRYFDGQVVIINDKFPKAKHHYLVIPRRRMDGIASLTVEELPLLDAMYKQALAIIGDCGPDDFAIGFHAVPSMRQMHMHVISRDFNSPHMKDKKHWNSFTTKFFINFADLREMVESGTPMTTMPREQYDAALKQPPRCLWCGEEHRQMPRLRAHCSICPLRPKKGTSSNSL